MRRRQFSDSTAAMEIAAAEQSLRAAEQQLEQRRRDRDALQITAPVAGQVIPPPRRAVQDAVDELPLWQGTPLEVQNLGASLDAGVLLCYIGDPSKLEAVIDVDQSHIDFVANDQTVKFKLDALPGENYISHISQIARLERPRNPREREDPLSKVLDTKYQASATLDDSSGLIVPGSTGTARIRAGYQTVGQRLWRYLRHTFRFSA